MMPYALLGLLLIILVAAIRQTKMREDLAVGLSMPAMILFLSPLAWATTRLCPTTLDHAFRVADLTLGLDGFALSDWAAQSGLFSMFVAVYLALPLLVALAWVLERPIKLFRAVVLGAILAFPMYLLFPAIGPKYVFADFPIIGHYGEFWAPRDCMPSMHVTWALLAVLNLRNHRWRWIFAVYAALMSLATVAVGEHYCVDVIAAFPYTFAVNWLARWKPAFASRLFVAVSRSRA
jgi:hypothetical protein